MRVAVLSDIHADLQALERVLDAVGRARADEVWCLGDIVGLGGSEPAAVVELVRERAWLRGGRTDASSEPVARSCRDRTMRGAVRR